MSTIKKSLSKIYNFLNRNPEDILYDIGKPVILFIVVTTLFIFGIIFDKNIDWF
jgi:hypothetical protein